ncbi:MAG: MFS transporter [Terricaulis sp.]
MSESNGAVLDLVDDGKLSGFQILIIALCAFVALIDGFDTQAIGFVAPVMAADLGIDLPHFGPVFSAALFGGLIGAAGFGALADRLGRRTTLMVTVTLFAAGSLLTATATDLNYLIGYRLLAGLGLGGAMPSLVALASEYSPKKTRTTLVTAMFCGFPLGAVIGAVISAPLIGIYGWKWIFVVGGVVPLLFLPIIALFIPESLRWLLDRGRRADADRILMKMRKPALPTDLPVLSAAVVKPSYLRSLFGDGRAIGTVLLACVFFVSLSISYLLVSWLPSIAVEAGHSLRLAVMTVAILNLSGIVGSLVIGSISDRVGPFAIVSSGYAIGAVGIFALTLLNQSTSAVFIFAFVAGLLCIGAQMCLVAVSALFYPVAMRGAGAGWCMSMGRVGASAGPLIGAAFIGEGDPTQVFRLVALLAACAGVGVFLIGLFYRKLPAGAPTATPVQVGA